MNLYKANSVDIWFTNSAWAVFRYVNMDCFRKVH